MRRLLVAVAGIVAGLPVLVAPAAADTTDEFVYFTNQSAVSRIAVDTGQVRQIDIGAPTTAVALSPDGRHAYVAYPGAGIAILRTGAGVTLPDGGYQLDLPPQGLVPSPDGRPLYVSAAYACNDGVIYD